MTRLGRRPEALIEVLHAAQEAFGFLTRDALADIAEALQLPLSRVYGVATFYSHFTLEPQGRHICVVCTGTACYISGAARLLDAIEADLTVRPGQTTTDGLLSLLTARCIGSCSLAPTAVVDGELHGTLTAPALLSRLTALQP